MIKRTQESPHVVSLTLERPEVFNALSFEVLEELSELLDDLVKEDVRVLIVTGSGKSFCSGADLKEIITFSPEKARSFSLVGHKAFDKLESFPCPVIAAVNGYALGGGTELACACDLIYASDKAKFGQPEAKVGMITGWGGTFRLQERIGLSKAKELAFTGKVITAEEARGLGLLNNLFPAETFWKEVLAVAEAIALNAPIAIRLEKRMMNRGTAANARRAREEAQALFDCVETQDQKEGVGSFLEKKSPVFKNR
jgi:enoyl-CoA hydratase